MNRFPKSLDQFRGRLSGAMTWHPRAKGLWKCPCWRDKEVLLCIFWHSRGGSLWCLPFVSSPSSFHGTLSPSLSGLAFWPHAFQKPGGQSLWYIIPVSFLFCLLSAGSGYGCLDETILYVLYPYYPLCIPQEEGTDIISAQGKEEGELTLHLQLPEMLSFLKGSGPVEASSHLPPSLQACLSPWRINSLPQDTEDTAEGSHFCKQ